MMNGSRVLRIAPMAVLLLWVLGCAYPISNTLRQSARKDLAFQAVLQNPEASRGAIVIWGGTILRTENWTSGTLLTVLQRPLDCCGRPKTWVEPGGRFVIVSQQFLDPAIYRRGRPVTVAGELTGELARPLQHVIYHYPRLAAREIHPWPLYDRSPYWPGYGPYYYSYYYGPYAEVPFGIFHGW